MKGQVGNSGPKSFAGWSFSTEGEGYLLPPSLGYLLLKLKKASVLDEDRYLSGHGMVLPSGTGSGGISGCLWHKKSHPR